MNSKIFFPAILVISLLTIISISYADDQVFYLSLTVYRNDTVTLNEFNTTFGTTNLNTRPFEENYTIILISKDNKILSSGYLSLSWYAHPMSPAGVPDVDFVLNKSEQNIRLPYFKEATTIKLLHNNKLIFKFDIPQKESPPSGTTGTGKIDTLLIVYVVILIAAVACLMFLLMKRRHMALSNTRPIY